MEKRNTIPQYWNGMSYFTLLDVTLLFYFWQRLRRCTTCASSRNLRRHCKWSSRKKWFVFRLQETVNLPSQVKETFLYIDGCDGQDLTPHLSEFFLCFCRWCSFFVSIVKVKRGKFFLVEFSRRGYWDTRRVDGRMKSRTKMNECMDGWMGRPSRFATS